MTITSPKFKKALSWFFKLSIVGVVILGVLMAYLDAQVRTKFEGKRWALPAKVFARPLELYPTLAIKKQHLLQELNQIGYKRVPNVLTPGQYSATTNEVDIHRRFVQLWDSDEPAARIRVRFNADTIDALWIDGQPAAIARLEPLLIGGIYPAHNEDRHLIKIEDVPQLLVDTLVAVEDREYFDHYGVSLKAIMRAMFVNVQKGELRQGGSTLTQQLVKNFFLTHERTIQRKVIEALMSLLLEFHYDKQEILEAYLNEVFLGQSGRRAIHGFGLASQYYFGKQLTSLNAYEIATLVGIVKGASFYNPKRNPQRATDRRNVVLDVMQQQGLISEYQAMVWKKRELGVVEYSQYQQVEYPAYLELVRRQLKEDYAENDLTSEGLRIFTSLDPIIQRHAEEALNSRLKQLEVGYGLAAKTLQGSVVVASTESGEVEAVVGDRNPRYFGFNRALDAHRSIGSLAKPAVYLAALRQPQYTLTTPLDDGPVQIANQAGKIWAPENYDKTSHGIVPLYHAMAHSFNQATARLGMHIGLENVANTFYDLGVAQTLPHYPSMVLGAFEMSPFDVAQMYQTIAASGFHTPLKAIRGVTTAEGHLLTRYGFEVKQTVKTEPIYLLQQALKRSVAEGTGRYLKSRFDDHLNLAGKTGTSDSQRDSWFAGFSGDQLAVVWVGRDDNEPTPLTGSSGALRVWSDAMDDLPLKPLYPLPTESIAEYWVEPLSDTLSKEGCQGAQRLPYLEGTQPKVLSDCANQSQEKEGFWDRLFKRF